MALDPSLQRLIDFAYKNGFGHLHEQPLSKVRYLLRSTRKTKQRLITRDILTPKGIRLRVHFPISGSHEPLPALIYIRGSAGIGGKLEEFDDFCQTLSNRLNFLVINIDFSLAPEFKFPIGVHDCLDSILWLSSQASDLPLKGPKLYLWGESSGGNKAAVVCQLLRDLNYDVIAHQTLIYPMVDLCHSYPSKEEFGQGYLLEMDFAHWLTEQYLENPDQVQDIRVSPSLNPNLGRLPPATIITAQYDPIRDEARGYAQKLARAQNKVFHLEYAGMTHGFMVYHRRLEKGALALEHATELILTHYREAQGIEGILEGPQRHSA